MPAYHVIHVDVMHDEKWMDDRWTVWHLLDLGVMLNLDSYTPTACSAA